MKEKLKKWIKPVLFTLGGAAAGLLWYRYARCASGTCTLTASPWITMAYMALVGWLLSGVLSRRPK